MTGFMNDCGAAHGRSFVDEDRIAHNLVLLVGQSVAKGPFSFASLPFKWDMAIGSSVIAQAPEVGYVVA